MPPRYTKQELLAIHRALGPQSTMRDVAAKLGCNVVSVQRRLSVHERKLWKQRNSEALLVKAAERAIKKIQAKYYALGRVPTAKESGVDFRLMVRAGGYNLLVQLAGLKPRLVRGSNPKFRPFHERPFLMRELCNRYAIKSS